MCESTLEKALYKVKGVRSMKLDLQTMVATVVYNPNSTTEEDIRQAIVFAGYDADGQQADPEAYQNLHECCKKGAHD